MKKYMELAIHSISNYSIYLANDLSNSRFLLAWIKKHMEYK